MKLLSALGAETKLVLQRTNNETSIALTYMCIEPLGGTLTMDSAVVSRAGTKANEENPEVNKAGMATDRRHAGLWWAGRIPGVADLHRSR